jgi:hypothetical protein
MDADDKEIGYRREKRPGPIEASPDCPYSRVTISNGLSSQTSQVFSLFGAIDFLS